MINYSIHPGRALYGSQYRGKESTRKNKTRAKLEQIINAVMTHCERHPRDAMKSAHLTKLRAALSSVAV